jgi:hypothetical protein
MAFRELGGDKSLPYKSCWFRPHVGDTGASESAAYDVVRTKVLCRRYAWQVENTGSHVAEFRCILIAT